MLPDYAELHCLSNFSFLRGASHPEELIRQAAHLGYRALALTDECSLGGVVRAHQTARELDFKLVLGTELHLPCVPETQAIGALGLLLLATDRDSYGNLSGLISRARRRAPKGTYELQSQDLETSAGGCLAVLLPTPGQGLAQAHWLAERFAGRASIAVELLAAGDPGPLLRELEEASRSSGLPLVASGNVHMHLRSRRVLQDTLTAIRLGLPLTQAGGSLFPNGERHLRTRARLSGIYPPPLLARTLEIVECCDFRLDSLRYEYPQELVPPGETPSAHLRQLTLEGFRQRYGPGAVEAGGAVLELVERELALIGELAYEPYFLTVHDIVRFARGRGILCQGRGSAANSAVCYCLGITEVDPARMQTLFERFISRERNEPPDIDVDFEHERREEVIQYIYAKYGRERAALAAVVISYRPRSALRDVGKALGLDLAQVDRLAKTMSWWDGKQVIPERLQAAGFDPGNPLIERLVVLVNLLVGFPRHLSQHPGGFVISRGPLWRLVPVENAAMPERTVIQWDKDDLDTLGLLKVDVLALGMLSAIRRALTLVGTLRGQDLRMADIPAEDPEVYQMVSRGDTVGVFQIESRAQQAMLPRLRPRTFYDLVVEVAIVRPGPIQGGMVHPYLRRRQGLEPVIYPSEAVRQVLERTLGVPIFQEQVMQLAVVAAGFTAGEADHLRRSMAAWRRKGGLWQFEERLSTGMRERGYSDAFAQQIFRQIQGFGEYGFPESHSASFALLVYVSAWLKHHEPSAFTCALLNSQPMGFYAPAQLIQDLRNHGCTVRPVDVCESHWDCTLEPVPGQRQPALRLGLRLVKGLGQQAAMRFLTARAGAPAERFTVLAQRAKLEPQDLQHLASAGALATVAGHRRQATWLVSGMRPLPGLLAGAQAAEPELQLPAPGEARDLVADYASLGFTLGRHPLALLRGQLGRHRLRSAAELKALPQGRLVRAAGLVIGRQRPDTASGVVFVTLEDETGMINVIVWRDLLERQRAVLLGASLLVVSGKLEREGEVVHLLAGRLIDESALLGSLVAHSRDFH